MKNKIIQAVNLPFGMGMHKKEMNNGIPELFIPLEDGTL